ncbi:MAG TPA: SH3 domain-containing protein [Candidatus Nanopelagicales bacterium]|nr:SH3 domain-containing protein [Candidatus Nanopelagicales bacterium]
MPFTVRSSITRVASLFVFGAFAAAACSATGGAGESEQLEGAAEVESSDYAVNGDLAPGMTLEATANVNLRSSASTKASVLRVVPEGSAVTVVDGKPQNGFYKVNHNGLVGWSFGQYYDVVAGGGGAGEVAEGTKLQSTTSVNLRSGPSTQQSVLTVVPEGSVVTVMEPTPTNGFYYVDYQGTLGWSSAQYYTEAVEGETGVSEAIRIGMDKAKSAAGFGYWWGHGRFRPEGPSASNKGSCAGSCPNCTYSGSYGGDCSGLAAKVWAVPSSNTDITVDSHPYSTADFVNNTSQWTTISRDSVKKGDAMVYRSGGAGHIFIYNSGDGWGNMYAYECKACAYGCVYGSRTAGSSYKAIRRAGW